MAERIQWNSTPFVTIEVIVPPAPRCPHCDSTEFTHWNTSSNGDGSTTEKAVCDVCSLPFRVVREKKSSGRTIEVTWPDMKYDASGG
jgi:hypothetical protein